MIFGLHHNGAVPTNGESGQKHMAAYRHPMGLGYMFLHPHMTVDQIALACLLHWGAGHLRQTGHMTWEWLPIAPS